MILNQRMVNAIYRYVVYFFYVIVFQTIINECFYSSTLDGRDGQDAGSENSYFHLKGLIVRQTPGIGLVKTLFR